MRFRVTVSKIEPHCRTIWLRLQPTMPEPTPVSADATSAELNARERHLLNDRRATIATGNMVIRALGYGDRVTLTRGGAASLSGVITLRHRGGDGGGTICIEPDRGAVWPVPADAFEVEL